MAGRRPGDARSRLSGLLSLDSEELQALRRGPQQLGGAAHRNTRRHNLSVIRRLLFGKGPQTRPELARLSGLSLPTVGALVAELIESGLVHDAGIVAESRVGKPASRVALDTTGNVSIALNLTQPDRFIGAVVDLDGAVVERAELGIEGLYEDAALERVVELVELLLQRTTARVVGIGVASPGLVDESGQVRFGDRLRWQEMPLAEELRARTGIPAAVGNDVNLLALGLGRFRNGSGRDAIVIALDNGVGGAVLEGGDPVLGEQFAAGEIGHITVDPGGELCRCGDRGCLDMVVGAPHLQRRLDTEGESALEPAGRILGETIAPIAIMLNINVVVVVGPEQLVAEPFAAGVVDGIRSRVRPPVFDGMRIEVEPNDPDFELLGAASLIMESELGVF